VTLYRSYNLRSSEVLHLSDAKQLKLWLDEQESDFSAFDKELDLEVVSFFQKGGIIHGG